MASKPKTIKPNKHINVLNHLEGVAKQANLPDETLGALREAYRIVQRDGVKKASQQTTIPKLLTDAGLVFKADISRAKTVPELLRVYSKIRSFTEEVGAYLKPITDDEAFLRSNALPSAMDREDVGTLTDSQTGDRITLTERVVANILAEDRDAAYKWFKANGHESIVIETINSSTLSSFVKSQMAEGVDLPPESKVKVAILSSITFTRGKKGKA